MALVVYLLWCARRAWSMWNGGNQFSAWASYLSFFRHVAKLPIDYTRWQHYEAAAVHGGPRWLPPLLDGRLPFVIVADRPLFIHRDEQARPHCVDGPFTAWRDGVKLYQVHGVRLPTEKGAAILAALVPPREIIAEPNAEIRRVMMERYDAVNGRGAFVRDAGGRVLDIDADQYGRPRRLLQIDLTDDEPIVVVEVTNSSPEPDGTFKLYHLRVAPNLAPLPESGRPSGPGQAMSCHNAVASLHGLRGDQYRPAVET